MRPLPIDPDPRADASYVRGTSRIRGERCPVFDTAALLGVAGSRPRRFVVVRDDGRRVALAVEAVLGVEPVGDGTPVEAVAESALFAGARWLA